MPDNASEPLIAHSLAEAYLYLMATPCASCGRGPLKGDEGKVVGQPPSVPEGEALETVTVAITATCGACRSSGTFLFQLPGSQRPPLRMPPDEATVVNPTGEPSRILDVGQWIVLFRMITEAASRETDKVLARHLGIEAAQCLEEALKFYDDPDNDLPPPEALFTETSRERFGKVPEQFSRRRLIELRAKLPTTSVMRARLSAAKRKPWWRWPR